MTTKREKVFEVAAALEVEGKKPTQRAVREALGGGSFSTINGFLAEYRENKERNESLKVSQVPQRLWDDAKVFVAAAWREANDIAQTENVALKERIAALESEHTAAITELGRLKIENARLNGELDAMNKVLPDLIQAALSEKV